MLAPAHGWDTVSSRPTGHERYCSFSSMGYYRVCCACTLHIEGAATSACHAARLGDCANVKQLAERLEWLGKQALCHTRNRAAFIAKLFTHGLLSKELLLNIIDVLLDKACPAFTEGNPSCPRPIPVGTRM